MSTPSSCRMRDAYTQASSAFAILKGIKQLARESNLHQQEEGLAAASLRLLVGAGTGCDD